MSPSEATLREPPPASAGDVRPIRFMTAGSLVATAVTVCTPVLVGFAENPPASRVRVVAESAILLAGATAGMWWAERHASRGVARLLVATLCILGGVVVAESDVNDWQSVMPLVSMAVLFGSTRWAVGLTVIYALEILVVRRDVPPHHLLETCGWFVAASTFVVAFSHVRQKERSAHAQLERLAADVERANQRLRQYAAEVEDLATTKERNRLSREIHDGLGHFFTVVHVQIEAAKAHLDRDPVVARECLARAQKLTHEGLSEVRRSVAVLRSAPTDQRSLWDAVASLVSECRASGLTSDLVVVGSPRPLSPPVEFALYRAVQEALTNVRRHAAASRVSVAMWYGEEALRLSVTDDGIGASRTDGGFGLLGLRERVQLVGGTVEIRTAVGRGFAIELQVPEQR
jgi:signal transduction histidine kinase